MSTKCSPHGQFIQDMSTKLRTHGILDDAIFSLHVTFLTHCSPLSYPPNSCTHETCFMSKPISSHIAVHKHSSTQSHEHVHVLSVHICSVHVHTFTFLSSMSTHVFCINVKIYKKYIYRKWMSKYKGKTFMIYCNNYIFFLYFKL